MTKNYSLIQVRILLALHQQGKLSKTAISRRTWKFKGEEKQQLTQKLLDDKLIISEHHITLGAKKATTLYSLSPKGKKWVNDYLNKNKSIK